LVFVFPPLFFFFFFPSLRQLWTLTVFGCLTVFLGNLSQLDKLRHCLLPPGSFPLPPLISLPFKKGKPTLAWLFRILSQFGRALCCVGCFPYISYFCFFLFVCVVCFVLSLPSGLIALRFFELNPVPLLPLRLTFFLFWDT